MFINEFWCLSVLNWRSLNSYPQRSKYFYRFGGNESWSGCCVVVVILFKMWKTRKKALRLAFISWFVLIFFIFVSNLQETYIHSWYILDTFLALLNNSVIIPIIRQSAPWRRLETKLLFNSSMSLSLMEENALPRNTKHTRKFGMTLFKNKMWKLW